MNLSPNPLMMSRLARLSRMYFRSTPVSTRPEMTANRGAAHDRTLRSVAVWFGVIAA
jgi:hypothetical protein